MSDTKRTIKIVLVGGCVGKTSLIEKYMNKPFSLAPTVFEVHEVKVLINHTDITLELRDTSAQEDYDRLRPLNYPLTDVFLVCYSVVNPFSLEMVKEKWVPEILHHCPKTPFILVGTQIDLRDQSQETPISYEQGVKFAKKIKAVKYIECCVFSEAAVKNVFDEAILAVISPPKQEIQPECCVS